MDSLDQKTWVACMWLTRWRHHRFLTYWSIMETVYYNHGHMVDHFKRCAVKVLWSSTSSGKVVKKTFMKKCWNRYIFKHHISSSVHLINWRTTCGLCIWSLFFYYYCVSLSHTTLLQSKQLHHFTTVIIKYQSHYTSWLQSLSALKAKMQILFGTNC